MAQDVLSVTREDFENLQKMVPSELRDRLEFKESGDGHGIVLIKGHFTKENAASIRGRLNSDVEAAFHMVPGASAMNFKDEFAAVVESIRGNEEPTFRVALSADGVKTLAKPESWPKKWAEAAAQRAQDEAAGKPIEPYEISKGDTVGEFATKHGQTAIDMAKPYIDGAVDTAKNASTPAMGLKAASIEAKLAERAHVPGASYAKEKINEARQAINGVADNVKKQLHDAADSYAPPQEGPRTGPNSFTYGDQLVSALAAASITQDELETRRINKEYDAIEAEEKRKKAEASEARLTELKGLASRAPEQQAGQYKSIIDNIPAEHTRQLEVADSGTFIKGTYNQQQAQAITESLNTERDGESGRTPGAAIMAPINWARNKVLGDSNPLAVAEETENGYRIKINPALERAKTADYERAQLAASEAVKERAQEAEDRLRGIDGLNLVKVTRIQGTGAEITVNPMLLSEEQKKYGGHHHLTSKEVTEAAAKGLADALGGTVVTATNGDIKVKVNDITHVAASLESDAGKKHINHSVQAERTRAYDQLVAKGVEKIREEERTREYLASVEKRNQTYNSQQPVCELANQLRITTVSNPDGTYAVLSIGQSGDYAISGKDTNGELNEYGKRNKQVAAELNNKVPGLADLDKNGKLVLNAQSVLLTPEGKKQIDDAVKHIQKNTRETEDFLKVADQRGTRENAKAAEETAKLHALKEKNAAAMAPIIAHVNERALKVADTDHNGRLDDKELANLRNDLAKVKPGQDLFQGELSEAALGKDAAKSKQAFHDYRVANLKQELNSLDYAGVSTEDLPALAAVRKPEASVELASKEAKEKFIRNNDEYRKQEGDVAAKADGKLDDKELKSAANHLDMRLLDKAADTNNDNKIDKDERNAFDGLGINEKMVAIKAMLEKNTALKDEVLALRDLGFKGTHVGIAALSAAPSAAMVAKTDGEKGAGVT